MPLTFTSVAGLLDLPDALFDAADVAADWGIGRICANTRFGALACEPFYGEYRDGDTVALPVSAVDGYHYSRDELVYGWMHKTTFDPDTGAPGGRGSFLLRNPSVDPLTGAVSSLIAYYVQGGAQTNTYDGLLAVWTLGVRGRGRLTMSAAPSFNDLADSAFAIDAAFKTLNATRLNRNAKLAAVRFEVFSKSTLLDSKGFPQGYSNGQTVLLPVSPVDGYTYARAELKYLPFWIYTGKSNRSGATGPGRIRLENVSVNTTTGVVTTQINYWDGTTETVTNDGIVGVLVLGQRAIGTMAAPAAAFTDLDDSLFFAGRVLSHTPLQTVNKNAKFSILRPEIFLANYTNGQTVALPTSPVDGYVYARNELDYFCAVLNTGAGQGGIRAESVRVNPATGLVSAQVQFEKDGLFGGGIAYGYDATVAVVTVARRGHETELTDTPPLEPPAPPAPAPPTWIEFSGEDGLFYFELATTESTGDPVYHEVQLASDSIFTTLLQTISMGTALHKNLRKPGVTRYARARSKFVGSDWSAWTAYGAPTAAFSGYPVDRYAPGGVFDPADRRFGNDVRQHDASGNPRHLFRYDDPTHDLGLVADGTSRKAATSANFSYRPLSNSLTAADAGETATVSIANFTMRVAGIGDIAVTGGSVATLAFSTLYFIYYDDPTFAGGTVTYNATTVKENVLNNAGRFFVGSILTPADGAAGTIGNNDGGVGAQTGFAFPLSPSSYAVDFSAFAPTNSSRFFDGDPNSYATVAGNGPDSDYQQLDILGFSTVGLARKSATLRISTEVSKNGTAGTATLSYSLNGGDTWTNIYSITNTTRAKQTDSVSLSAAQCLGAVRVRAYCIGNANVATINILGYETWIDVEG